MEDFVTFEIAKILKEKGFKNDCIGYYDYMGEFHYNYESAISNKEIYFCHNKYDNIWHRDLVDAPTISQVLKWLREEKDIDLVISPVFFYDDVLGKMREYECEVFTPSLNKPEHCGYHKEWEQTALAGIEYVLDNLV